MTAWWKPSLPGQIGDKPWLGERAIIQFAQLLKPEMSVLEFGAGGSTVWLAQKVRRVVSIENNPKWFAMARMKAGWNAEIKLWGMPDPPEFHEIFDLVFIDGEPPTARANWIRALPRLLKPGGYIVLDNANRPEYALEVLQMRRYASLLTSIKGKGGTYTWTEFYKWRA